MFTGIIEEIGTVKGIKKGAKGIRLTITAKTVLEQTKIGDSISTNGVCLTVSDLSSHSFSADVMPETMNRSNLGELRVGSEVNLERALRLSDRLGGHLVSGHIDGTALLVNKEKEDNAIWLTLRADEHLLRYVILKGSVAMDGVSLTVAEVDASTFKVSIIPLTQTDTTLINKPIGATINIENDMIAKYVENFLKPSSAKKEGITIDYLIENGF